MKKNYMKITGVVFAIVLAACITGCGGGGGGGSGSSPSVTTSDGITIPTGGGTGTITITGGTNKYGFNSLWKSGTATYPQINEIFESTHAEADLEEIYLYFGDNNLYFLILHEGIWYLAGYYPYSYNSLNKTFTVTGPNPLNSEPFCYISSGMILVSGNNSQILYSGGGAYNFFKALKADLFSATVISLDDATLALLNDGDETEDNTLVTPTINSLTASYSGGTVTFNYNITAPGMYTVNSIKFRVISPNAYNWLPAGGGESDCPVYGQVLEIYKSIPSPANTVSGTATLSLTGPENGTWYIASVGISCSGGYYWLESLRGKWKSTYYYEDDDKYKNTGVSVKTFNVTGSTADTTAPTLVSLSISGTTLTINASDTLGMARIAYVANNHYAEEDGYSDYRAWGSVSGSTATFNLSGSPSGTFYIAQILLYDSAGNCSIYYGYDTDVSLWSGIYAAFGLDFSKYNRYWADDNLPTVTTIPLATFTR